MTATTSAAPRRRRVARTAAAVSLFLTGILFGEAIDAVAHEFIAPDDPAGWDAVDAAQSELADALALREFATADALDGIAKGELDAQGLLAGAPTYDPYAVSPDRLAVWELLASCETGEWTANWVVEGSGKWDYGTNPGENGFFEGGIQFHPRTWDAFKEPGMPDHAGEATREQQIYVGEKVLAAQGWRAWPACSLRLGYR